MKTKNTVFIRTTRLAWLWLAVCGLLAPRRVEAIGNWTTTLNAPSGVQIELMLLLSDGTVMAQDGATTNVEMNWYQLTPDSHGSYVNGKWKALRPMHYKREMYALQVLRDGRVFIGGDENDGYGPTAEVYNPLTDAWTLLTASGVGLADAESAMLPDGRVLVSPKSWLPYPAYISTIYDPVANSWSFPGSAFAYQDETSWVKLSDDSILTIDDNARTSERFIPSRGPSGQWSQDANVPVGMWNNGETGPGLLLPDGRAFYLGGTGHTALYTRSPLGGTNAGSWAQGPDIPAGHVSTDAPAVMMPNGKILCAVGALTAPSIGPPVPEIPSLVPVSTLRRSIFCFSTCRMEPFLPVRGGTNFIFFSPTRDRWLLTSRPSAASLRPSQRFPIISPAPGSTASPQAARLGTNDKMPATTHWCGSPMAVIVTTPVPTTGAALA